MKVLLTGETGMVGSALAKKLTQKGHTVHSLVRKKTGGENEFLWDIENNYVEEGALKDISAIIHLAGSSIFTRWTSENKEKIVDSRVAPVLLLKQKCIEEGLSLDAFISASGINYYGTFTSEKILSEDDLPQQSDFLSEVCMQWENAADTFQPVADRVIKIRISPVLSKKGGSLEQLLRITNFNLASGLGSGKQWFNWIHIEDLVNMFLYALEHVDMAGAYNAVADEVPTQRNLMKAIAKKKEKLFVPFNVPSLLLKAILGEMSSMILKGSRVSNGRIKSEGFSFIYPDVASALEQLIES